MMIRFNEKESQKCDSLFCQSQGVEDPNQILMDLKHYCPLFNNKFVTPAGYVNKFNGVIVH